jgi:hypothetical protein
MLLPDEVQQRTCFYNPFLAQVRLNMGGFGVYPSQAIQTWNDMRFISMCKDALNLENSEIANFSDGVMASINPVRYENSFTNGQADGFGATHALTTHPLWVEGDRSNFFLGFSVSQTGFQAGCLSSPNNNVTFELRGTRMGAVADDINELPMDYTDTNHFHYPSNHATPIMLQLVDAAWLILVEPQSEIPTVKLTDKQIL